MLFNLISTPQTPKLSQIRSIGKSGKEKRAFRITWTKIKRCGVYGLFLGFTSDSFIS